MNFKIYFLLVATMSFLVNGEHTPILDMIPGVAHIKAAAQTMLNDKEGANKTLKNVNNDGIFISQAHSIVQLINGNVSQAAKIQGKFLSNLEPIVDSIPIIGHAKGIVHHALGDHEHGWDAIKSATSSTGAVIGGIFGGPGGAVAGHMLSDAAITSVETTINQEFIPHGFIEYASNIDLMKPGDHIDAVAGLALDAVGGHVAKNKYRKGKISMKNINRREVLPEETISLVEVMDQPGTSALENIRRNNLEDVQMKEIITNENTNQCKLNDYKHFFLKFHNRYFNNPKVLRFVSSGEVFNYRKLSYLNKLNLKFLRSQLTYLNDDLKSLITKDNFKTVNTVINKPNNCVACTLGALLEFDVEILMGRFLIPFKLYDPVNGIFELHCFDKMKNVGFIDFSVSPDFFNMREINSYLKEHAGQLENKDFYLSMGKNGIGHSATIKYKMVHDNPEVLIIDYQESGLLTPEIPNPEQFKQYFDFNSFDYFRFFNIEKIKPNSYFLDYLKNTLP